MRRPHCADRCGRAPGHEGVCACEAHLADSLAPACPRERSRMRVPSFVKVLEFAKGMGVSADRARSAWLETDKSFKEIFEFLQADARDVGWEIVEVAEIPVGKKLRADHPTIQHTVRGSREAVVEALSTAEGKLKAMQELENCIHTANSRRTRESYLNTYCWALQLWGSPPFPITELKIRQFGAAMRAGRFRSCAKFLFRAIQEDERRRGQKINPVLIDVAHDVIRAAERGIGPNAIKVAITVEKFAECIGVPRSRGDGGENTCFWPEAAFVLGSWFLTRGIELSASLGKHFVVNEEQGTVSWSLPASKTDVRALGQERTFCCSCKALANARELCPVHLAAKFVVARADFLADFFLEKGIKDLGELPLFPNLDGKVLTQENLRATMRMAATQVGEKIEKRVNGEVREADSEHVMRVSGAQFLFRLGLSRDTIKTIGRWSSQAIDLYLQDAPAGRPIAIGGASGDCQLPETNNEQLAKELHELQDTVTRLMKQADEWKDWAPRKEKKVDQAAARNLVCNKASGTVHRILIGPDDDVEPRLYRAFCGWAFANCLVDFPVSLGEGNECRKCRRKGDLARRSLGAGDGSSDSESS